MSPKKIRYLSFGIITLSIILYFVIRTILVDTTIQTLNEHSHFSLPVLYQYTTDDIDDYNVVEGFGMDVIYDINYPPPFAEDQEFDFVEYSYSNPFSYYDITSYPSLIGSNRYVTGIETSDPDHHIFGLYIGDTVSSEDIENTFKDYHYSLDLKNDTSNGTLYVFTKSKVTIKLHVEQNIVSRIIVRIHVTSIPGIVF